MIFKLQRSISNQGSMVLTYNEDRSAYGEFPLTPQLEAFFGDDLKLFVEADLDGSFLNIKREVADPGW